MTTGAGAASDPYATPSGGTYTGVPGSAVFEITLTTELATAMNPIVSGTTNILAETYNGAIPGPTFRLTVGDTVIVRLVNNLPYPTGIHWHGIELNSYSDGTEVTQGEVPGGTPPIQVLGNGVPAGGTFLYKFKVNKPGIFWYHPHHHNSTNRVFRGLYGMIVVTDLDESSLADGVVLPLPGDTKQIVLSDVTVCQATGANGDAYAALGGAEWLSGVTSQPGPTPTALCEIPTAANGMTGAAVDDHGMAATASYALGEVPSLMATAGRINEGQIVLTNGVNVGGRPGQPLLPGTLVGGYRYFVRQGQGLRLQIVNCATTRYFRLFLTYDDGTGTGIPLPLVRVGGEGGLLDHAVLEGGVSAGGFDAKYTPGEILLPPSARADVVVAIPPTIPVGTVLTLWTRDFERLGATPGFWAMLPTVPVMHLQVDNVPADSPAYTITGGPNGVGGTPLRKRVGFSGPPVVDIRTPFTVGTLLNPTTFGKPGDPAQFFPPVSISDIQLTNSVLVMSVPTPMPSINGISGHPLHGHSPHPHYPHTHHVDSSRYAEHNAMQPRLLELTVTNTTDAHHPFHLHGFSIQPISLTPRVAPPPLPPTPPTGTFTWLYNEFRDSIDVPAHYTLTFRVRLDDRTLVDGLTMSGALGRWFFHCHIFFHHHRGMIGELVVTDANGNERPNVNVGGSWAYAPSGGVLPTPRRGTFMSPEGSPMNPVTLDSKYGTAGALIGSLGTVTPTGPDTWSWNYSSPIPDGIYYVYITATDTVTLLQSQCVFRLNVGLADDGSDVGDPHIHTVDGKEYAFQAVGEFTLLRDRDGLEIQTRQTPLESASPFTDNYSGLTSSVSVNTAIAARVGSHRISYQPSGIGGDGKLQFFLDGKPARLSAEGIDLESHRVSVFDADGEMGLRVDYAHGAVLTVTPRFWFIWFLDIWVSHTHADEGIMGSIPNDTWLPTLPNGATVGPMPEGLHDRYVVLYKTFADAWRLTDATSLFVYEKGTSTETFTDRDWPAEEPPSILKPQFKVAGFPAPVNIPVAEAEQICQGVTMAGLHANCVFDVGTTGDKGFAKAYLLQQELRLHGSTVQIVGDRELTRPGEALVVTAIVLPMTSGRPTPAGSVTFMVDGVAAGPPVTLNDKGRAQTTLAGMDVGEHKIRASYTSDGGANGYHSSTSPNLLHKVEKGSDSTDGSNFGCSPVIWILIILILIAIAAYVYFS